MSAKILPLQPPRQLETLDDLLAQAEHYAEFCMRNSGRLPPPLFLIGPKSLPWEINAVPHGQLHRHFYKSS
jgi:hypothetical protein